MTYKSLATFLHDPDTATDALEYAIEAARVWDAHLHIITVGINRTDPGFYYAGAQAVATEFNLEQAREDAHKIETSVHARLDGEDIKWDFETVTLMIGAMETFIASRMQFFDVAILPLPADDTNQSIDQRAFEACIFGANIPVIVVPAGFKGSVPQNRVLVAWDEGPEALSAARASLPIARQVGLTDICIINPPQTASDRSDPGGRLAQFMTRAGAKVEVTVAAKMKRDVAEQLCRRAAENGAEMIVMGAYGHSRLREAIIGGATRSMLRQATLPVLMAR